ncbi:DUF6191 domain-containing protein [Actinocorallia populi]|uniref:DUF6191 domain-containing protein n=1 Tax=Actinocorallia populi TaxID=2079200 RepID=UPI000D089E04|nr:DUF6191 domain-containing protein [Actinocorallia populi]
MKSPFRRRRKRSKKADELAQKAKLEAKMAVPEWAQEGTGGGGLMNALRGDGEAGAGFGAGIFEDLHSAFSGAKKIQLQEQEAEKLRRVDDQQQAGTGGNDRPDLDSGRIRIRAAKRPEQPAAPEGDDETPPES